MHDSRGQAARRHSRDAIALAVMLVCAAVGLWRAAATSADAAPAADPYAVNVVETSANLAERMKPLAATHFEHTPPPAGTPVIAVNDSAVYQHIQGFGAAMTDSSAWLIEHGLPAAAGQTLMNQLFATSGGIDLDFVRVPIGASDFTAGGRPYSYDDMPAGKTDPKLQHFSIAHDLPYILPALTQAKAIDPATAFLASPWSPPAWMKHNNSLSNAYNKGTLRAMAYGPWAQYVVRFLQAYAAAGIPITALTPANEPGNPTAYPGMNMSPGAISNWIRQDLAPALARAKLTPQIYGQDQGWSINSAAFAQRLLGMPAARNLAGLAWHCYYGSPDVMTALHTRRPTLPEIVDECSPGITPIPTSEVVIASLRDWAGTVALWNLALDPTGGPVQAPDSGCPGCYGLATINPATGQVALTKAYYQLGQASSFILPGAQRIGSNNFVTYPYTRPGVNFVTAGLDDVAVANANGTRVLMVYNNTPKPVTFAVSWHNVYFQYAQPAGATTTFDWNQS